MSSELVVAAAACGAIAYGEFVAARTAWRWGDELPERFQGLEKFFSLAASAAGLTGALAVFFGFLAATSSSLDDSGAAATWQLVVLSPVMLAALLSWLAFMGVLFWDLPPFAIPPALRGSVTVRSGSESEDAYRHRLAGQPRNVPPDRVPDIATGRRARHEAVRLAVSSHRRATRRYATAMFIAALLPVAAAVLLGLGSRGAGGVLDVWVAFLPLIGAGVVLASYGVLMGRRRLPSVLHPAVPPRGAGIALVVIGIGSTSAGLAAQELTVAARVVAVCGAALCCSVAVLILSSEAPKFRDGESPRLAGFVALLVGATGWAAAVPVLLR